VRDFGIDSERRTLLDCKSFAWTTVKASTARREIPRHLAEHGFRLTGGRRAVIDVLTAEAAPLSVADIHVRLTKRRVNLVTVYRAVDLLQRLGLLRAVDTSQGSQRFELAERFTGHHHHLVCQDCGGVQDVDGCVLEPQVLEALGRRMERSLGFRVSHHDLKLLGLCKRCAAK